MRALKAVGIVMAVLIVVGVVAVVWAIFNLQTPDDNRPSDNRNIAQLTETLSLGLPAACVIAGMELDGTRLAVRTEGPAGTAECERIYIVDLSGGNVVSTVGR